jgi:hypothetical protein
MIEYEEPIKQVLVFPMQFSPLPSLKLELTFQVKHVCLQGLHLFRFYQFLQPLIIQCLQFFNFSLQVLYASVEALQFALQSLNFLLI